MKIVFIASLSHSGSTLLDLMLNASPDIVSVGELKKLGRFARFEQRKSRHSCTCGCPSLWDCGFWSKVNAHTKEVTGQTIAEINVENYSDKQSFQRDNITLFSAISSVSGKKIIVEIFSGGLT